MGDLLFFGVCPSHIYCLDLFYCRVDNVLLHNIMYSQCTDENETSTGVSYSCNQCEMKTAWRSAIVRHIKEKHVIVSTESHTFFFKQLCLGYKFG